MSSIPMLTLSALSVVNPNQDGYKKCVTVQLGIIHGFQVTIRKQEGVSVRTLPHSYWSPEPVVRVAIWRINREVVNGQYAVRGEVWPPCSMYCLVKDNLHANPMVK
jgi:hypothetical protein